MVQALPSEAKLLNLGPSSWAKKVSGLKHIKIERSSVWGKCEDYPIMFSESRLEAEEQYVTILYSFSARVFSNFMIFMVDVFSLSFFVGSSSYILVSQVPKKPNMKQSSGTIQTHLLM